MEPGKRPFSGGTRLESGGTWRFVGADYERENLNRWLDGALVDGAQSAEIVYDTGNCSRREMWPLKFTGCICRLTRHIVFRF